MQTNAGFWRTEQINLHHSLDIKCGRDTFQPRLDEIMVLRHNFENVSLNKYFVFLRLRLHNPKQVKMYEFICMRQSIISALVTVTWTHAAGFWVVWALSGCRQEHFKGGKGVSRSSCEGQTATLRKNMKMEHTIVDCVR